MYISSHATLKKTFTAKYKGVLPRTPQGRPKSEIYTPKRDLRPFQEGFPPRLGVTCTAQKQLPM